MSTYQFIKYADVTEADLLIDLAKYCQRFAEIYATEGRFSVSLQDLIRQVEQALHVKRHPPTYAEVLEELNRAERDALSYVALGEKVPAYKKSWIEQIRRALELSKNSPLT